MLTTEQRRMIRAWRHEVGANRNCDAHVLGLSVMDTRLKSEHRSTAAERRALSQK